MLKGRILHVDSRKCGLGHGEFQSCLLLICWSPVYRRCVANLGDPTTYRARVLSWLIRLEQLNQQTTSRIGSCARNCASGPNLSEFFMTSRNPTDETSVQGTVMKEANDENSSAIGCEV